MNIDPKLLEFATPAGVDHIKAVIEHGGMRQAARALGVHHRTIGRSVDSAKARAARQGYTLHHTPAAAKVLAGDKVPPYGARELRRTVSRAVEQALADRIAAGTAHPGTVYTADVDADGHIILTEDTLAACV